MPKYKAKNDDVEIKVKNKSSMAEFVKKPLPSEEEVEAYEEQINEENREEEIEESLNEIYQDDNGDAVNVRKLMIQKRRGLVFWISMFVVFASIAAAAVWIYYQYIYLDIDSGDKRIELNVEAPRDVVAGEEFIYVLNYKNDEKISLRDVEIKMSYPENFLFLSSSPEPLKSSSTAISVWQIPQIGPESSGKIEVKGRLIGEVDSENILLVDMVYTPSNFTSEFKKSISFESFVSDLGIDFSFDAASSVLVNDESEVVLSYKAQEDSFFEILRLSIEPLENMSFVSTDNEMRPGVILLGGISKEKQEVPLKFKFLEKTREKETLNIRIDYLPRLEAEFASTTNEDYGEYGEEKSLGEASAFYTIFEKEIELEVLESDLSLNLIINGSRFDQGVDFGDTLNYSIVYANKGDSNMKDIVVMAAIESDFVDWETVQDENEGEVRGNSITWDKEDVSKFSELEPGEEGTIDFSIQVKKQEGIDPGKEYQIKSFAQFNIGSFGSTTLEGENEEERENDTRSNVVTNKINSNLDLVEKIIYYNEDNITVGDGPIPPKVGETTSYKVIWKLTNSLHELNSAKVSVELPDYLSWGGKEISSVGTIQYNSSDNSVIWDIGRLPMSVSEVDAEFYITLTPEEKHANKILILMPGSTVTATDEETDSEIVKKTVAKTTKLEDDDIASLLNGDGRIAN